MHRLFFISVAACLALANPLAAESRFCRDAFDTVKDELEDYSRKGKISKSDLQEIRDEIGSRAMGGVRTMRTNLSFDLNPAPSLQAAAATQLGQRLGSA
jgi:hypothetical protein